ncbi:MAG TPA: hypothetical protein VGZ29_10430 [Terriglobia bacterium]|nr:hypothetical protein [Terriglobia bacterium]
MNSRWLLAGAILAASLIPTGAKAARARNPAAGAPSSAQTSPAPAASPRPARVEPKAQALLDRALQALGGPAFLSFQTLTTHGRLFSISSAGEGFVYFDSQVQFPDKRRLAYGLSTKSKPIIIINNGDLGWEIDRMGMVHLDSADIRQWAFANRYGLENLLRLRVREPGTLVQAEGVDFVNNLPVDILDIVDARQTQIKLCLAHQTALPVEVTYRKWNTEVKDWDDYADDYADFRTFQGIPTPMHITHSRNGRRYSEVYRNSAVYNETYPEKIFHDPGAPN